MKKIMLCLMAVGLAGSAMAASPCTLVQSVAGSQDAHWNGKDALGNVFTVDHAHGTNLLDINETSVTPVKHWSIRVTDCKESTDVYNLSGNGLDPNTATPSTLDDKYNDALRLYVANPGSTVSNPILATH